MNPRDEALRWLEEAEFDLKVAEDNARIGNYNWACFISQQAGEKAVKALHIAINEDIQRIHSVTILIKGDPNYNLNSINELLPLLAEAQELDQHYIPSRYPNSFPFGKPYEFYNEIKARECVKCAKKIVQSSRTILENL